MSITRRQFELAIDDHILAWMKNIHEFLLSQRDEAFTRLELIRGLGIIKETEFLKDLSHAQAAQVKSFDEALKTLVDIGAAEKRLVRGTPYHGVGAAPLEV